MNANLASATETKTYPIITTDAYAAYIVRRDGIEHFWCARPHQIRNLWPKARIFAQTNGVIVGEVAI